MFRSMMPRETSSLDVPSVRDFHGREAELARIAALIDVIAEGGAALVIRGAAGIGKTALLEVAQIRARGRGLRVLRMSGVEAEAYLPFAALQQAMAPILRESGKLPPRQHAALLAAFGLSEDTAPPDLFLVAMAILTLLTDSAARKPILLVADDVQWLDQSTSDVLAFIARRLSSDPIVLLMAEREGCSERLACPGVLRHQLDALDEATARRLLAAHAPDLPVELHHRFLEEAGGNPLALVELPHGERITETGAWPWLPLTNRLERAFLSRVSGLPAATRTLLLLIAANNGKSLREVLDAGAVLLGAPVKLDVLTPAISAMLIEVFGVDVRFRHPLMRSAVYQAASLTMRRDAHSALGSVIKDQPDRRIWHRMVSTIGPDESLAVELDALATRAQRRGVLAAAIEALVNAARLSATAEARSERFLRASGFAAELGQPETVARLLRDADLDRPPLRARAQVAWVREMSQPLTVNDLARISALVAHAADARADGASDLALDLLWRAAQRCHWADADGVRVSILTTAHELGSPESDARLIAISAYIRPLEHGHNVYRKLTARAATGVTDPMAAWILGLAANTIGAFEFGVTWLNHTSLAWREQGRLGDLPRVLFGRSFAETEMGNWTAALQTCEEAIRFGEETGQTIWVAATTVVQSRLAALRGNFDVAEAHAGHAERLVLSPGTSFWRAMLQNARGCAALGAGRPAEAFEHLQRVHTPADPAFNTGLQFFSLADYVEACLSCGQEVAAASVISDVGRRAGPTPVPWVQTMLCYGKALLAPPSRAEMFFTNGLGAAAENWPFLRARLLLAYGGWLRRQRRIAEARAPLRTAREIFDALGAVPWSERARRELRAAGEASRPRAKLVLDVLTPQELHIAELAAGGLSNKEIGARLYLSHRTVGYHLHRIFPKLGITARAELRNALGQATQVSTDSPGR